MGLARRASVLGRAGLACWGAQGGRRMGTGGRAGARASGSGAGRAAGRWERGRARPGRLGWPWAVHSVHSAHFRSVLTQYFPESIFLDIVREPGS